MQQIHADQTDRLDIDQIEDIDVEVQAEQLRADDIETATFAFSAQLRSRDFVSQSGVERRAAQAVMTIL